MTITDLRRRQASPNPLHPWTWVARYRDGTEVRQISARLHRAAEIDAAHLEWVRLDGPPPAPVWVVAEGPPQAVSLLARTTVGVAGGATTEVRVQMYAGLVYADGEVGWWLDPHTGRATWVCTRP